jgi:hypothetical protein
MFRHASLSGPLLLASLAGCASPPSPLSLSLTNGQAIEGTLPTVAYTSTRASEPRAECRASYTGRTTSSTVLLEVRCTDGRYGIGTGELGEARLVAGKVRMQDGEEILVQGQAR